jgi:hypothetical protein
VNLVEQLVEEMAMKVVEMWVEYSVGNLEYELVV